MLSIELPGRRENDLPVDRSPIAELPQQRIRGGAYSSSLRDVHCVADRRGVILRGCAGSYYLKQLAQEIVRGTVPGAIVINQLKVLSEVGCLTVD